MNGQRLGDLLRAARMRLRLTQLEVGSRAGVSQSRVSDAERGRLDTLSIPTLERIAAVLDVRLFIDARWRNGDADRLLDRTHASIVEVVVGVLAANGWDLEVEFTFNHYGERGSVDVIAWYPLTRSLLIVEVKSRIVDLQDLFSSLGRKVRVLPRIVRIERGWNPATVSRLVVLPGTTSNRALVSRHAASFRAVLPATGIEVRRWLRAPSGSVAGVWFLSFIRAAGATQVRRVRRAHQAASTPLT